jgi:hypothetical protein
VFLGAIVSEADFVLGAGFAFVKKLFSHGVRVKRDHRWTVRITAAGIFA